MLLGRGRQDRNSHTHHLPVSTRYSSLNKEESQKRRNVNMSRLNSYSPPCLRRSGILMTRWWEGFLLPSLDKEGLGAVEESEKNQKITPSQKRFFDFKFSEENYLFCIFSMNLAAASLPPKPKAKARAATTPINIVPKNDSII